MHHDNLTLPANIDYDNHRDPLLFCYINGPSCPRQRQLVFSDKGRLICPIQSQIVWQAAVSCFQSKLRQRIPSLDCSARPILHPS